MSRFKIKKEPSDIEILLKPFEVFMKEHCTKGHKVLLSVHEKNFGVLYACETCDPAFVRSYTDTYSYNRVQ